MWSEKLEGMRKAEGEILTAKKETGAERSENEESNESLDEWLYTLRAKIC